MPSGVKINIVISDLDGSLGNTPYCYFCFYLSLPIYLIYYWYYNCFTVTKTTKQQMKFSISPVKLLNSWCCCLISSKDKQAWNTTSCTAVTLLYASHMLPAGTANRNKNWNTTPRDLILLSISMLLAPTFWLFVTAPTALGNDRLTDIVNTAAYLPSGPQFLGWREE